jgi:hypothetical protein
VDIVANEHSQRETLDLVGAPCPLRAVHPYPLDHVMDCGVRLDGEAPPRLFSPSALARRDSEADDRD